MEEDRAEGRREIHALKRDVVIGAGIGCAIEGGAAAATGPVIGWGTPLACADGALNGGTTALGVWFFGALWDIATRPGISGQWWEVWKKCGVKADGSPTPTQPGQPEPWEPQHKPNP